MRVCVLIVHPSETLKSGGDVLRLAKLREEGICSGTVPNLESGEAAEFDKS